MEKHVNSVYLDVWKQKIHRLFPFLSHVYFTSGKKFKILLTRFQLRKTPMIAWK
jgi:hypothetical protein